MHNLVDKRQRVNHEHQHLHTEPTQQPRYVHVTTLGSSQVFRAGSLSLSLSTARCSNYPAFSKWPWLSRRPLALLVARKPLPCQALLPGRDPAALATH